MRSINYKFHALLIFLGNLANIPCGPISPALVIPSPIASHLSYFEGQHYPASPDNKQEVFKEELALSSVDRNEDMECILARLSLYESLVFPFSLETSVSWSDAAGSYPCQSIDSIDLNSADVPFCAIQESCTEISTSSGLLEDAVKKPNNEASTPPVAAADHLSDNQNWISASNFVHARDAAPFVSSDSTICYRGNTRIEDLISEWSTVSASPLSQSLVAFGSNADTPAMLSEKYGKNLHSSFCHSPATCKNGLLCKDIDAAWRCHEIATTSSNQLNFSDGPLLEPGKLSSLPMTISGSTPIQDDSLLGTPEGSSQGEESKSESALIGVRRGRRFGIYGSLPSVVVSPETAPLAKPGIPSASEKRRSFNGYALRRDSNCKSVLCSLVLPLYSTTRESSDNGASHSDEPIPSNMSQQSICNSIGLPPPFPLPDVPLSSSFSSSSASTLTPRSALDKQLDLYSEPGTLVASTYEAVVSTLTLISSRKNEKATTNDLSGSNSAVNWGIAL